MQMRCGPLISDRVVLSKHRQKTTTRVLARCTRRDRQQGGGERTNKNDIKHERKKKR